METSKLVKNEKYLACRLFRWLCHIRANENRFLLVHYNRLTIGARHPSRLMTMLSFIGLHPQRHAIPLLSKSQSIFTSQLGSA